MWKKKKAENKSEWCEKGQAVAALEDGERPPTIQKKRKKKKKKTKQNTQKERKNEKKEKVDSPLQAPKGRAVQLTL